MATTEQCVLCKERPPSRRGEHVLPRWYFGDLGGGAGPLAWAHGGELLVDRTGTPIKRSERVRVFLPVCAPCNAALDRRFEQPAKEPLRRLFATRGELGLVQPDVELVSLWLVKTLLLLSHPAVRYGYEIVDAHSLHWNPDEAPPPPYYSWLVEERQPPRAFPCGSFALTKALLTTSPRNSRYHCPRSRGTAGRLTS